LRTRHWLIGLISELRKAGKTIITTTHDISLVKQISSRVIVLGEDHGVIADGTPPEVIADHELLHRANIIHEHELDTFGYSQQTRRSV
ncbi:MAG: nickel ABC transporter ATP-binding protein, partial [Desulfomonilia bacterium]